MTSRSKLVISEVQKGRGLVLSPFPIGFGKSFKKFPYPKKLKNGNYYFQISEESIRYFNLKYDVMLVDRATIPGAELLTDEHYVFKTTPYKHQLAALAKARGQKAFAYFMEMGTGKTKVTIDEFAALYAAKQITAAIIIAPNGVHRQWKDQISEHLRDDLERDIHIWKKGSWTAAINKLNMFEQGKALKILCINVESVRTPQGRHAIEEMMHFHQCVVVVDESSRIKNPKAQQTKHVLAIGEQAIYRRILSGTPITQGLEDLFTQFKFLDEKITGFRSYWSYKTFFCKLFHIPGMPHGAVKVTGYKNVDQLQDAIRPYSFVISKSECLDLPPKIYMNHPVILTDAQKALYKQLQREFFATLDDDTTVDATLAITQLLKLQQVICGHIRDDDGQIHMIRSNRIDELVELVNQVEGKVIIWSRFVPDLKRIAARFPNCVRYHGEVTNKEREENIAAFVKGDANPFIGQQQSGGLGLNLAVASTVIYFSNTFSLEHRLQSEDRAHRIGTKNPVTYVDLVAEDTIDLKIISALKNKKSISSMTLDDLRVIFRDKK